eukprot:1304794-Prymnesium_polylepis.1
MTWYRLAERGTASNQENPGCAGCKIFRKKHARDERRCSGKGLCICGCPVLSYASRPVWLQGKGPRPPIFLPALSGHSERIAGLNAPSQWARGPGIHQRCSGRWPTDRSPEVHPDLTPPEMRVEG